MGGGDAARPPHLNSKAGNFTLLVDVGGYQRYQHNIEGHPGIGTPVISMLVFEQCTTNVSDRTMPME